MILSAMSKFSLVLSLYPNFPTLPMQRASVLKAVHVDFKWHSLHYCIFVMCIERANRSNHKDRACFRWSCEIHNPQCLSCFLL